MPVVEIVKRFKDRDTGKKYTAVGDKVNVSEDLAKRACDAGRAKRAGSESGDAGKSKSK